MVCLGWYNSDLNLKIAEDFMTGFPIHRDGWGCCFASARATHGLNKGKIWFEVKYVENLEVKVEKETTTFDLRVGWSSDDSGLMRVKARSLVAIVAPRVRLPATRSSMNMERSSPKMMSLAPLLTSKAMKSA